MCVYVLCLWGWRDDPGSRTECDADDKIPVGGGRGKQSLLVRRRPILQARLSGDASERSAKEHAGAQEHGRQTSEPGAKERFVACCVATSFVFGGPPDYDGSAYFRWNR